MTPALEPRPNDDAARLPEAPQTNVTRLGRAGFTIDTFIARCTDLELCNDPRFKQIRSVSADRQSLTAHNREGELIRIYVDNTATIESPVLAPTSLPPARALNQIPEQDFAELLQLIVSYRENGIATKRSPAEQILDAGLSVPEFIRTCVDPDFIARVSLQGLGKVLIHKATALLFDNADGIVRIASLSDNVAATFGGTRDIPVATALTLMPETDFALLLSRVLNYKQRQNEHVPEVTPVPHADEVRRYFAEVASIHTTLTELGAVTPFIEADGITVHPNGVTVFGDDNFTIEMLIKLPRLFDAVTSITAQAFSQAKYLHQKCQLILSCIERNNAVGF